MFYCEFSEHISYTTPPEGDLYASCNETLQFIKDKQAYGWHFSSLVCYPINGFFATPGLKKLIKFKSLTTWPTKLEFHEVNLRKSFTFFLIVGLYKGFSQGHLWETGTRDYTHDRFMLKLFHIARCNILLVFKDTSDKIIIYSLILLFFLSLNSPTRDLDVTKRYHIMQVWPRCSWNRAPHLN